jgi:cation:H+ antiporter
VTLTTAAFLLGGLTLLVLGAEVFVRGASRLASAFGISPLVIGLTVVAFGTSSPEIAVSVQSAFAGAADIAMGNVIGSNICNILLILGLSAVISPMVVSQQLIRLDVPVMIGVSFLVFFLGFNGQISRTDGILLFGGAVGYTSFLVIQSRKQTREAQGEFAVEYGAEALAGGGTFTNAALIFGGLALLILGSRWLVDGAVTIAQHFGFSQLVIGLTVVAIGTSLPELATSMVAAMRGERDIAVGNVVGSNIFNILLVLGLSAIVAPSGIPVPAVALRFDIPVMIAVAVACLPIFFTDLRIDRWKGFLFVGYYVAYTSYLILASSRHDALPIFSTIMQLFVIPLTVLTLLTLTLRSLRERRRRHPGGGPAGG